ncbi:Serine/threonine protein kinase [Giardia duodenalis assemblage B]|uniref:Serine/threonine protein kinase n=1 Tax=Giardia duodenalis assemblage B TaxID=1394984 RepID=A0A132NM76_GIAIN|nr:Serine/threonine protein kinase [Giardia intestinalis assemblage B]
MEPAPAWALSVGPIQAWLLAATLSESHLLPRGLKKVLQGIVPRMSKGQSTDL